MSLDTHMILKRRRYGELMQAGRDAYQQGHRRLAHDYWREAATVDPYVEEVWLALYRVVETEEDRVACLENIIAINPMNVQARRRLHDYQEHAAGHPQTAKPARQPDVQPSARREKADRRSNNAARNGGKRTTKPSARAKKDGGSRTRRILIVLLLVVLVVLLALVASGVLNVGQG